MPEFARGFRLHPRSGPALDGAAFPSDREAQQQPCAEHSDAPVIGGLCGGCTQYGDTLPGTPTVAGWTGEQQGPAISGGDAPRPTQSETGLPPAQPCTDPRHTGPIREQLGCTGPDPATT